MAPKKTKAAPMSEYDKLPRTPKGQIDKRTNAYKEYMAKQAAIQQDEATREAKEAALQIEQATKQPLEENVLKKEAEKSDAKAYVDEAIRGEKGLYLKGTLAGPGRPTGSKNRRTVLRDWVSQETIEEGYRLFEQRVLKDDIECLKLMIEYTNVKPKGETYINFDFGPLAELKDVQDAMARVLTMTGQGSMAVETSGDLLDRLNKMREFIMSTKIEDQQRVILDFVNKKK